MTLAQAKAYLRIFHSDDDEMLLELIRECYAVAEARTGRQIRTATAVLTLDQFPADGGPIVLPRPPLVAVSSLQYFDAAGDSQTIEDFQTGANLIPGMLGLSINALHWPSTANRIDAITITYTCGGDEPEQIRSAIRLLLDLAFNDIEPTKSAQQTTRIDSLLHGYTLRDPRLFGITT